MKSIKVLLSLFTFFIVGFVLASQEAETRSESKLSGKEAQKLEAARLAIDEKIDSDKQKETHNNAIEALQQAATNKLLKPASVDDPEKERKEEFFGEYLLLAEKTLHVDSGKIAMDTFGEVAQEQRRRVQAGIKKLEEDGKFSADQKENKTRAQQFRQTIKDWSTQDGSESPVKKTTQGHS